MQEGSFPRCRWQNICGIEAAFGSGAIVYSGADRPDDRGRDGKFCHAWRHHPGGAGALIGFAGPRVIEQTIGEKLPEGFQRAQFQLEHGFVDRIVERKELKLTLYRILKLHHKKRRLCQFRSGAEADCLEATELMKERATKAKALSAWEKVKAARKVDRLASVDYIEQILTNLWNYMETGSSGTIRRLSAVWRIWMASQSQ